MGIEGRKKSILATDPGRHHTIGDADLRALSTDMLPLRSGGYRSTDSEAMNIVEIMILIILKRKARIVERCITRMEKHETGLFLLYGELVFSIVFVYHLLKGRTTPASPLNFAVIRLVIPA